MENNTKIQAPIVLSTGTMVMHKPYGNGATEAYLANGNNMTDAEWIEYCKILHQNKKEAYSVKPNRFYIFDCFGNIAGNLKGYRTMRGAMQQASSPKTKLNRYLWHRAESYFPANRTTQLIYSIRLIEG